MKKVNKKLTWREVDYAIQELSVKLKPLKPFLKNIYGLPRGGLIPAVMLSHKLGIPLILDKSKIDKNTLIVDDICDSGKQLHDLTKKSRYKRTVTIMLAKNKKPSLFTPSYYQYIKREKDWIVFPWED